MRALFLHGFTGSGDSWAELAAAIGSQSDCPDLPGHVDAELPKRLGREGFEATIDALAGRLTEPSVVIGYSQGARLALALAVRHPERITRLILESGTPGLTRHRDRAIRQAEDERRARRLETFGLEAFLREWERLPLFAGVSANRALATRRRLHSAAGLAGALRCLGLGVQPNFWPALPRVRIPTLLITGANDSKFTALAHRMAAELPLAWHVTVAGAGHAVHLEAPALWASEVRGFLHATFTPEHQSPEARI